MFIFRFLRKPVVVESLVVLDQVPVSYCGEVMGSGRRPGYHPVAPVNTVHSLTSTFGDSFGAVVDVAGLFRIGRILGDSLIFQRILRD